MQPSSLFLRFVAMLCVLHLGVAPSFAQRQAGPFSGILGGTNTDAQQTLDARGSIFTAWDDTISITGAEPVDDRFLRSGFAGGLTGSLQHMRRSGAFEWVSSAATSMRMYGTDDDGVAATFSARSGGNTNLGKRVSLTGSVGLMYSPYYQFAPGLDNRLSPTGAFGGGFGVATAAERNLTADAAIGLNFRVSQRDSFNAGVNMRRDNFLDQDDRSVRSWGGSAGYRRSLTDSLGVHAGYGRERGTFELGGRPVESDNIDVGLDYGDTLAFSRRTALSFSTATSAVRWDNDTHYRVNGSAALTRAFTRTASGSLTYSRGTELRAGFREPLLNDTVSGGISDQLGRRARWSAQVAYERGNVGFGSEDGRQFNAHNAGAELTTALTRHIGVTVDYTYYRYDVPAGSTVFTTLPKFSRQSITAGLTLWAPLISDKRSPRDTR